jgi:prolyl-tRNA editing enzyme YbaK/EbsC (Cys-tRNA(Pro) deacylase)
MASTEIPDRRARLTEWAADRGVTIEIQDFPEGTRTAEDAAAAIGCELAQIVKSLVFVVDDHPVVVLMGGADQLDPEKLRAAAGGGRAKRADAATVRESTGYPIGGVPPFAHLGNPDIYMDEGLLDHEVVWAAAGTPSTVFAVRSKELGRITEAVVALLARR